MTLHLGLATCLLYQNFLFNWIGSILLFLKSYPTASSVWSGEPAIEVTSCFCPLSTVTCRMMSGLIPQLVVHCKRWACGRGHVQSNHNHDNYQGLKHRPALLRGIPPSPSDFRQYLTFYQLHMVASPSEELLYLITTSSLTLSPKLHSLLVNIVKRNHTIFRRI